MGDEKDTAAEDGGFGPPVGDFGPPTGSFGPPTGARPEPVPETSDVTWRPIPPQGVSPQPAPPPAPPKPAPDPMTTRPANDQQSPHRTGEHQVRPPWETDAPPGKTSGRSTPGLSWSDDPIAQRLTPQSVTAALAPSPRSAAWLPRVLAVVGVLVVVIGVVVGVAALLRGGPSAPAPAAPALACPAGNSDGVVTGNGSGSTDNAPDAVLGFQHAFYVDRNGAAARRFVADDAPHISAAAIIQQAIDTQIPVGTSHCLRIVERAPNTLDVDLTERRPDGPTTVYRQTVTTVQRNGKTVLYAIDNRR